MRLRPRPLLPAPNRWVGRRGACQNREMPVHDVAAAGFDAEADTDERARPSCPPDAVARFVDHLRIGLVWNARDRSVDRVDEVWSIMDRVEQHAPWREHEQWHDAALGHRAGFGALRSHPATRGRDIVAIPYRVDAHWCEARS